MWPFKRSRDGGQVSKPPHTINNVIVQIGQREQTGIGSKEDPGCALGFEHLVNAEPGPMGAGAGAAAAIENNEPSPRGAAIEKAQAELRRDLAVREERRRELEFLEKGGEPLDFKFGETPQAHFSSLSPTDPLADHLLKSEGKGEYTANVVAYGVASNLSDECGGEKPDADELLISVASKNETGSPGSCSRLDQPNISGGELNWTVKESPSKKESECSGGAPAGLKYQTHVKRNRHCSQRLGNGHALPKQLERVGAVSLLVEGESKVPLDTLEDEAMVDMSYQFLPHQSSPALLSKWNGLTTSQEFEPVNEIMARCGPVLEQHATDPSSKDRASLPSHKSLHSSDVKVILRTDTGDRKLDNFSVATEVRLLEEAERGDAHGQLVSVQEADAVPAYGVLEGTIAKEVAGENLTRVEEEGIKDSHTGDQLPQIDKREKAGPFVSPSEVNPDRLQKVPISPEGLSKAIVEGNYIIDTRISDGIVVPHPPTSSDDFGGASNAGLVKKAIASRGGNHSRLAIRDRSAQEERRVGFYNVRIKSEEGVAEDRAKNSSTDAELGGLVISGAPNSQEELRAERQAGAIVGGVSRIIGQLSSGFASSNCKYPNVVLPWEKEQNPEVQAEAERHKAELHKKALKAQEDFILEEAENLKAKRKFIEEWKSMKKWSEPLRRKTHWDFVLEEMEWLANDFAQERLWKRAQAAHFCRAIAFKKGENEFLASELSRRQHKLAGYLAQAVKDFWRAAESTLTKEKAQGNSWPQEKFKSFKTDSEAVPMDVDIPFMKEASEKLLVSKNPEKERSLGILGYALRFLKASGVERIVQAEAPATPERYWESNSVLDPFWEDQFSEEPLYYVIPSGSMEAYRASMELERAKEEEEYEDKRAASFAEAEALAAAEAAEDANVGADFSFADLSNDGGSQEDEPQGIFMVEGGHSRISKKKRKKILKTNSAGTKIESSGLQGFPYRSSPLSSSDMGAPSPVVTGKRSFPGGLGGNSLPGSIPVKRARSSAANLRPRASNQNASPGTGGFTPQAGPSSHAQQDDDMDMIDGSNRGDNNIDTPNSKMHGVGGDASYITNKSKKKKKTKAFQGLSGPRSLEGGLSSGTPSKSTDGVSHDLLRYEQMKRKGDPHWPSLIGSDAGTGANADTPGTPGSQGPPGQQSLKKQKSLKQNESNLETAPTGLVSTSQAATNVLSGQGTNKLVKQNSIRDRNRRMRPNKVPPSTQTGFGIPWSASEDQAILALVHDLGPNWDLVSDVLSSNSQIKGIYRKPKQCKERHKSLTERVGPDGLENPEDPSSSQPHGSKGNVRGQRVQGAPEEDTLKHLEQIIQISQKHRARKSQNESEEQKILAPPHPSHGIAISQFCTGGPPNPLDLCDRFTNNGDIGPHTYPIQPSHGNVLGPPNVGLIPGLGMRPPAGGLPPVLTGGNGLHLGQSSVSSTAAMNAAAARDVQRFTMKLSPEEAARLRMATSSLTAFNQRRVQQQAASVTSGLPVLGGLPNPNDLPMLPASTSGILSGLSRGLSLPRVGLPGMGSPVVSSMGSAGLGGMLPPAGSLPQSNVSRRISNMVNMARMGCSEDQRLQIVQQLQSLAQQGESLAANALSTLNGDMAAVVASPPQPYSPQHHQLQQQQQQEHQQQPQHQHQQQQQQHQQHQAQSQSLHCNQQQQQMQLQAPQQAYFQAAARMKDQHQRQQQQLQNQQKQRLLGSLPPSPQSQHMLVSPNQPPVPTLPSQHMASQPHILSQQPHNSLQKQVNQQQVGGATMPQPGLTLSNVQSSPASPASSGQANAQQIPSSQQNQPAGQMAQVSGSAKPPQAKQMPKYTPQSPQLLQQQQTSRNLKVPSRGTMMMQSLPTQPGLPSNITSSLSAQVQGDTAGQVPLGQRAQPQSGQVQAGKAQAGSQPGNSGGSQSQGSQLHGVQSQNLPSAAPQHKGLQQQQQQTPLGGVIKQQTGAPSQQPVQAAAQQSTPQPTASQQLQPVPPTQQSQQLQRRQVTQPQPPRRLQTRHPSPTLGMPLPGQLGKSGVLQVGTGIPTPMTPPNIHSPYQLGGVTTLGNPTSMSNSNQHGMPLSSALNSSTVETQSAQWKSNQSIPPLSGGIYNLTRTNNPGSCQVPALSTSGLQLPSSNGNAGMSSVSSTGMHSVGLGSMPQGLASVQGASGLHSQKLALAQGVNVRALPGSQQVITSGQRSQHASVTPPPMPMGNMPASQTRPPVPPSTTGGSTSSTAGVVQGTPPTGLYQGVSAAGPRHSMPMSGPMLLNSGQLREPHGGIVSSPSTLAVSQRTATSAATSGSTTPSTTPAQGPLPSVEVPASSS